MRAMYEICNKDLLYSTGNYIQYFVMSCKGKESKKEYINTHICISIYLSFYLYIDTYICISIYIYTHVCIIESLC